MTENKVLNEKELEKTSGGKNENPYFSEDDFVFHHIQTNYFDVWGCPHCKAVDEEIDANYEGSIFRCKSCGWIDWSGVFVR